MEPDSGVKNDVDESESEDEDEVVSFFPKVFLFKPGKPDDAFLSFQTKKLMPPSDLGFLIMKFEEIVGHDYTAKLREGDIITHIGDVSTKTLSKEQFNQLFNTKDGVLIKILRETKKTFKATHQA